MSKVYSDDSVTLYIFGICIAIILLFLVVMFCSYLINYKPESMVTGIINIKEIYFTRDGYIRFISYNSGHAIAPYTDYSHVYIIYDIPDDGTMYIEYIQSQETLLYHKLWYHIKSKNNLEEIGQNLLDMKLYRIK